MAENMFSNYPDCMSVSQLQEALRVGKNAAYRLLETGQIKHRRLGKKYLIPKVYVIEYLLGVAI